jgi:hypothetical protein
VAEQRSFGETSSDDTAGQPLRLRQPQAPGRSLDTNFKRLDVTLDTNLKRIDVALNTNLKRLNVTLNTEALAAH